MNAALAKTNLNKQIKALHAQKQKPALHERQRQVDELIEAFISETGDRPGHEELKSLADYLMIELMTDQQKHHRSDEYPFLTNKQLYRRAKRQIPASDRGDFQ